MSEREMDRAPVSSPTGLSARVRALIQRTFRSLHNRNYRLYFIGQIISNSGTWMQSTAQGALVVFTLHGSALDLGITVALQFTPVLLFGAWGGVLADRFDKRHLMIVTQSAFLVQALVIGLLVATGVVQLWMVWLLALIFGGINVVDNPARQAFVVEMVGPDDLANAVGLNSVIVNSSRVIGPALAGALMVSVGIAATFLFNAASYVAVIFALVAMEPALLHTARRVPRARGQVRAGLSYAWSVADLRIPLLLMALIGTLGYNFSVLLPLMAKDVFHSGAGTYSLMSTAMGAGALMGALYAASRSKPSQRILIRAAFLFGATSLLVAWAPSLRLEFAALVPMGAAAILYVAMTNSLLQLVSKASMRGRVMALWAVVFLGGTPIGGLFAGSFAAHFGARWALGVGGMINVAASLWGWYEFRRAAASGGSSMAVGDGLATESEPGISSAEVAEAQVLEAESLSFARERGLEGDGEGVADPEEVRSSAP